MRLIFYIAIVAFLYSCSANELGRDELIKWVENPSNGLCKIDEQKNLVYELFYCPDDYLIAKQFRNDEIEETTLKQRMADLKGFDNYRLRIKRKNSNAEVITLNTSSQEEITQRIDYLSYGFEENIVLVKGDRKDTIPPVLYHFERTYGIVPYLDILFSFKVDSTDSSNDRQVLINDNVFGTGFLTFDFDKKNLVSAPKLKTK